MGQKAVTCREKMSYKLCFMALHFHHFLLSVCLVCQLSSRLKSTKLAPQKWLDPIVQLHQRSTHSVSSTHHPKSILKHFVSAQGSDTPAGKPEPSHMLRWPHRCPPEADKSNVRAWEGRAWGDFALILVPLAPSCTILRRRKMYTESQRKLFKHSLPCVRACVRACVCVHTCANPLAHLTHLE